MITVAPAAPENADAIADLLQEMDRFYGDTPVGTQMQRAEQVRTALFGEPAAGAALLAWDGDQLAGIAAYAFLWPAIGVTTSVYLKELYVRASHRRRGIGRQLMNALLDLATKHGCSRVEWTTDRPNATAQTFYAALDAPAHEGKLFYRLQLPPSTP